MRTLITLACLLALCAFAPATFVGPSRGSSGGRSPSIVKDPDRPVAWCPDRPVQERNRCINNGGKLRERTP